MKITSYDSRGEVTKVINFDDFVPGYVKSFDKDKSVISSYKKIALEEIKGDNHGILLNTVKAKLLFDIDFGNFLESQFALQVSIDDADGETIIKIPELSNCVQEDRNLAMFINYYGHKSKSEIINSGKQKDLNCLSDSTWIQSLIDYAVKRVNKYEDLTKSKDIAFRLSLQAVINRYYLALKNRLNFIESPQIYFQLQILSPFISRNIFRIQRQDIEKYHTQDFIRKFVCSLTTDSITRRNESYSILQMLRGDYKATNFPAKTTGFSNFVISEKKYSDTPHKYTISEFDGGYLEITLYDKELACFINELEDKTAIYKIIRTFEGINKDYINKFRRVWDNNIFVRRLAVLTPNKVQDWAYLLFDERARICQLSEDDLLKEQVCFHDLVYRSVNYCAPQSVEITPSLLFDFFSILKINHCKDQHGFYEKIYTINEILSQADLNDIKLMSQINNWSQIELYKKRIEAVNDMISFIDPVLNSSFVNVDVISIDNLKKLLKNILRSRRFFTDILLRRTPSKYLDRILQWSKLELNCNVALLFNVLGVLYMHVIHDIKGPHYLLKETATQMFDELSKKYNLPKQDKNTNKYLTAYDDESKGYRIIGNDMENFIIEEMRKRKYFT